MKNKNLMMVVGTVTVLAVLYVVVTLYAEQRARTMVEHSMQVMATQLSQGETKVDITSEKVEVQHFSLRPVVSVQHVTLTAKRGDQSSALTVPELRYVPMSFNMRHYQLMLMGEATVTNEANKAAKISFSSTPMVEVAVAKDGTRQYRMDYPQGIVIAPAEETNDLAEPGKTVTLNVAEKPLVDWQVDAQGVITQQNMVFRGLTVAVNEASLITVDGISYASKALPATEGGAPGVEMVGMIENLSMQAPEANAVNPLNLVSELQVHGNLQAWHTDPTAAGEIRWDLKNVALMTGSGSVYLTGDVAVHRGEDPLPYGKLSLRLTDLSKLFGLVATLRPGSDDYIAKLKETLAAMSGADLATEDTATVVFERQKGGHLNVGQLTLEEALAKVIGLALQMPKAPEVEEEPAAAAPSVEEGAPAEAAPEATTVPEVNVEQEEGAAATTEPAAADVAAEKVEEATEKLEEATEHLENAADALDEAVESASEDVAAPAADTAPADAAPATTMDEGDAEAAPAAPADAEAVPAAQ